MAIPKKAEPPVVPVRYANKEELNRLMDEIEARMGIVYDPEITIAKLRQMMKEEGIRPEDNAASREILRMRYGDEVEE